MALDSQRPSGSSGGAMAVLMGLFILVVIILGGGAYLWLTQVRTAQRAAMAEREAAMHAMMAAERAAEAEAQLRNSLESPQLQQLQGPSDPDWKNEYALPAVNLIEVVPADGAKQDISIMIDEGGNVAIHDVAIPFDQIAIKLQELVATNPSEITISIWPDEACNFRHVAQVVRICHALERATVQIAVNYAEESARSR